MQKGERIAPALPRLPPPEQRVERVNFVWVVVVFVRDPKLVKRPRQSPAVRDELIPSANRDKEGRQPSRWR
jgi:hypothetical protein